jgi:hypothetical protein
MQKLANLFENKCYDYYLCVMQSAIATFSGKNIHFDPRLEKIKKKLFVS